MAHYTLWIAVVDFSRYFLEATRPHHRPLFTLDELTFLSLPVALIFTVTRITERRKCKVVLGLALVVAIAIALGYPYSASLWVYGLIQIACIGGGWFFFARAFWRGKCWMGITEITVLAYLSAETVVLLGNYFPSWPSVWSLMTGLNIVVLALHAGWEASTRIKRRQEYD